MKEATLKVMQTLSHNLTAKTMPELMATITAEALPRWVEFVNAFSAGDLFKAQKLRWTDWLYADAKLIDEDRAAMKDAWSAAYQAGITEAGTNGHDLWLAIDAFFKMRADDTYFNKYQKRNFLKQANQLEQTKAEQYWHLINNKQGWEWWTSL